MLLKKEIEKIYNVNNKEGSGSGSGDDYENNNNLKCFKK